MEERKVGSGLVSGELGVRGVKLIAVDELYNKSILDLGVYKL